MFEPSHHMRRHADSVKVCFDWLRWIVRRSPRSSIPRVGMHIWIISTTAFHTRVSATSANLPSSGNGGSAWEFFFDRSAFGQGKRAANFGGHAIVEGSREVLVVVGGGHDLCVILINHVLVTNEAFNGSSTQGACRADGMTSSRTGIKRVVVSTIHAPTHR
jgi:hypothetical protein